MHSLCQFYSYIDVHIMAQIDLQKKKLIGTHKRLLIQPRVLTKANYSFVLFASFIEFTQK